MTDRELEQRLRAWYRAEIDEGEMAPIALRISVAAIADRPPTPTSWRTLALLAAAAMLTALLIGGAIAIGSGLVRLPSVLPPSVPQLPPSSSPGPTSTQETASNPAAWTVTGVMTQGHDGPATRLLDGRVLVAGGGAADALPELYDPATGRWTTTSSMVTHRAAYTATLLLDGRVLVAGGTGDDGIDLAAAELFDPTTGRWTATGSMAILRSGHTATLLADGKVLVAGGQSNDRTFSFPVHASAELYDPATGRWTATGSMAETRWGHSATLLPDGTVMVAGGAVFSPDGSNQVWGSAERYDPASGRWTTTGSMGEARWGHIAIMLRNGTVLVVGGAVNGGGSGSPPPEIFDPTTGRWAATGTMTIVRSAFTATLLVDGQVLIAGGQEGPLDGDQIPIASAELYDPTAGRWTVTASMAEARSSHTATLLLDGTVLIAGGVSRDANNGGVFISVLKAALYHPSTGN